MKLLTHVSQAMLFTLGGQRPKNDVSGLTVFYIPTMDLVTTNCGRDKKNDNGH